MALPKVHGGLGFKAVKTHSTALLCRWILQALDNPDSEWARLFSANLQLVRWINHKKLKRYCYQATDLLLLGRPTGFRKLPYTGALWQSWSPLREQLILRTGSPLIGRWLIEDVLKVLPGFQDLPHCDSRRLADLLGRLGAKIVQHLWSMRDWCWRRLDHQLPHLRGLEPRSVALAVQFFDTIEGLEIQEPGTSTTARSWQWLGMDTPLNRFILPNGKLYQILLPISSDMDRLNRIWGSSLSSDDWNLWWDSLWTADLPMRSKVFLWRVISQGFYTQKKAAQIGRDSPSCTQCQAPVEDLPHVFQTCSFAMTAWKKAFPWLQVGDRRGQINLLQVLGLLLPKRANHTARLMLLVQVLHTIWIARMKHVREGLPRSFFIDTPLRAAVDSLRAMALNLSPGSKYLRIITAKQGIQQWRIDYHLSCHSCPPLPLL
ncbi:unnamed protein product [Calypogeia fissa]